MLNLSVVNTGVPKWHQVAAPESRSASLAPSDVRVFRVSLNNEGKFSDLQHNYTDLFN